MSVPIPIPYDLPSTMSVVTIRVSALHPETGAVLGHRSTTAVAWADGRGGVVLESHEAARLRAVPVRVVSQGEATVEDGVVGREMSP